jgi:S1-C subfamily serine protease
MSASRRFRTGAGAFTLALTGALVIASGAQATLTNPNSPSFVAATASDALIKAGIPLQSNTIADIAQSVAPAVVNIEVNHPISSMAMGSPFNFFFNGRQIGPNGGQDGNGREQSPPIESHDVGSGFIIRPDGYIVTNAHVIKGATKIKVTTNDKRVYDGTVVGVDGFSDLGVVKINGTDLPTVPMGSSASLRPGEFCIAIGSPINLDHTVTFGIISAVGRTQVDINGNINFIQTDAAINPGNSGGPLLNLSGEVVGVNTAIDTRAQNVGYSIPIDIVKSVAPQLIEHKKINRPWLGIAMADVDDTIIKSLGLPNDTKGVLISGIQPHSPAQSAGLERYDIIQKIDGKDMSTSKEVQEYVRSHKVEETIHMAVVRNNTVKPVVIVIGQYPDRPVGPRSMEEEDRD